MKFLGRLSAGLLAMLICLVGISAQTGLRASAATKLEYVVLSDAIRQSIAAYAKTYAAKQASSSSAVLAANKNSMMPVRSSGDCATFVSSCLAYAGIPYDTQGSNQWQAGVTLSFAGTAAIGTYLKNNRSEGNGIKATQLKDNVKISAMSSSDWSKLKVGDVVCMKMSGGSGHTVVVVQEGNSMNSVKLASHTRDGIYDFAFWKSAVSSMDIYHLEGFYRSASDTTSTRVIYKTGQKGENGQIAYLKNKSTGAPLTTQGYMECDSGNAAYSLRTDKYYPGKDSLSKSSEGVAAQTKRIIEMGVTHSQDSAVLFNAKLGLTGSNALKNATEAVSATQLAIWVAEGQLTLSKYSVMGTAGTRVLGAVNALLKKTKTDTADQPALAMTATSKIKASAVKQGTLTGPFTANTSYAYTVAIVSGGQGSYVCDEAGNKMTIFEASRPFYIMVPATVSKLAMGVTITSSQHMPVFSAWQSSSTQPLVLSDVSADKRKTLKVGVSVDKEAKSASLTKVPPSVGLSDSAMTLYEGESGSLSASPGGSAKGKTVTWGTSNKKVATVTESGVVKAVGVGNAVITASVDGVSEKCALSVREKMEGIALRVGSPKAIVDSRVGAIDTNGSYPFTLSGRTMVPVRFTSEKMGASVQWTSNQKPITIVYNGCVVTLTAGSKIISVIKSGKTQNITIDQAAVLKNGRVYVPLRAVAERLGFVVKYDAASRVIIMTEKTLAAKDLTEWIQTAKNSI